MIQRIQSSAVGTLVILLVSGLAPGASAANERCAALITSLALTGAGGSFVDYFVATETGGGEFFVWRDGDNCTDGEETRVWYSAQNITTGTGDLSLNPQGPVNLFAPTDSGPGRTNFRMVDVNVGGPITGVEKATLHLDRAQHSGQDVPFFIVKTAPLYVLDTNGAAGFALGESTLNAREGLTARIPVFRTGPVSGAGSVEFEIEPMTATPGEDYTVPSTTSVNFSETSRTGTVSIPIKTDGERDPGQKFRVRLLGAAGSQTEIVVTIVDTTLEDLRPKGRLHHPKQSLRYPQNYPWLNEIHIFTSSADEVRAPVTRAQLAIRKRLKSGACAWWNSNGFRRGSCEQERWFGKNIKKPSENYFKYKVKRRLPLSIGPSSKVADYKIWGRWFDKNERVSVLKKGRNLNEFEVIKPTEACRRNPFNFRKCKPVRP
jgi:Calx-beta domain